MRRAVIAVVSLAGCAAATAPDASEWFDWTRATEGAAFGARAHHSALAMDGAVWVIGGAATAPYDDVWRSGDGAQWTAASTAAAFGQRTDAATTSLGGVMWVIGGVTPSGPVDDVWWSRDGVEWRRTTAATGTQVQRALVLDDQLYVLGGGDDPSVRRSRDGSDWALVTADAEPLRGRTQYAAAVHDGRIWIAGGLGTATSANAWREDVWSSADGATWTAATTAAPFPHRPRPALVSGGGLLWLVAGDERTDVWLSADGAFWSLAGETARWPRRTGAAVVAEDDVVWMLGGVADGQALADVWWAPIVRGATP